MLLLLAHDGPAPSPCLPPSELASKPERAHELQRHAVLTLLACARQGKQAAGAGKAADAAHKPPAESAAMTRPVEDASKFPAEQLFQLRRVHLTLPPSPLGFESRPTVCCKVGVCLGAAAMARGGPWHMHALPKCQHS